MKKPYHPGDMVKVKAMTPPCYALPDGLPDGATVKVLNRDIGYDDVEYEGKVYCVSMTLVDSGYEPLPENTPWLRPDHYRRSSNTVGGRTR